MRKILTNVSEEVIDLSPWVTLEPDDFFQISESENAEFTQKETLDLVRPFVLDEKLIVSDGQKNYSKYAGMRYLQKQDNISILKSGQESGSVLEAVNITERLGASFDDETGVLTIDAGSSDDGLCGLVMTSEGGFILTDDLKFVKAENL